MKQQLSEEVIGIKRSKVSKNSDGWCISDAVLLSEYSRNTGKNGKPRRYLKEALRGAAASFEGIQVNVNHPPVVQDANSPTGVSVQSGARNVLDTIGQVKNAKYRVIEQNGRRVGQIIGDLDLVEGVASNHLAQLAKKNSKLAGMSFTGDGSVRATEKYFEIYEIQPRTVDAVHAPATSLGFFEADQNPFAKKKAKGGDEDQGSDEEQDAAPMDDEAEDDKDDLDAKAELTDTEQTEPGQEDGEEDGDEESPELEGEGSAEQITEEANQLTESANQERSAESHMKAAFGHMKAAGLIAEMGDLGLAKRHADKSRQHEAVSIRLKSNEKQEVLSPKPQDGGDGDVAPMKVESLYGRSGLAESTQPSDVPEHIKRLYSLD